MVDQQYIYLYKQRYMYWLVNFADKVNQQEIRLNELSRVTVDWAEKLKNVANQTAALSALLKAREASLSLLHGSITLLDIPPGLGPLTGAGSGEFNMGGGIPAPCRICRTRHPLVV